MSGSGYRMMAPNIITGANIAAGFAAMIMAGQGRFVPAVYLLFFSLVFDTLDGTIARRLGATSEFGQELDSFSDAISFGAAPAYLAYQALFWQLGIAGYLLSLTFLLAAVYRLARFVLTSDAHDKERRTSGVPAPIAASYIMALVLMRNEISIFAAILVTLFFSGMMVSHLRLPNLKGKNIVTMMMLVGVVNYSAVVLKPCWLTIVWWNIWNALIFFTAYSQDRSLELKSS